MLIKILGTRGEIESRARYHSKHSGVLIDNDILLDLGEPEFLNYHPDCVFITHLHPDHAFFVRNPVTSISSSTRIFAPENYGSIQIEKLNQKIRLLHGYEVTPIPTHHSHRVASQAYIIKKGKVKILYTGDMIWIDKQYHPLLEKLDLVITEGSFIHKGGFVKKHPQSGKLYGHAGIPNLINLFSHFTRKIILVHFGTWFYQDIAASRKTIKKLADEYQIKIEVGYDGLEIIIN